MAGSALDIHRFKDDGRHVVEPRGDIDLATARELGTVLREEVQECPEELVVDLSETTHLDSTGVAVLLNAQRRLTRAGSRFAVVAPAGRPAPGARADRRGGHAQLRSAVGPGAEEAHEPSETPGPPPGPAPTPLLRLRAPDRRPGGPRRVRQGPDAGRADRQPARHHPACRPPGRWSGPPRCPVGVGLAGRAAPGRRVRLLAERLAVGIGRVARILSLVVGVGPLGGVRLADGVVQRAMGIPIPLLGVGWQVTSLFQCGASFPVRVPGAFFDSTPGEKVRSLIDQPTPGVASETTEEEREEELGRPGRIRRRGPVGEGRSRSGRQRGRAHRW